MAVVAADATVERHNEILRQAHDRIDGSLEERLAALIQPILERAGQRAASFFQQRATNHLTAAVLRQADAEALTRIPPGLAEDGFFGYRLRPTVLAAAQDVTKTSTMIAVKPRPDEAAQIAMDGGVPAEDLHVTLVYLGETEGDLADVVAALQEVAATHAPLVGVVGGVGRFQPPGVAILLPDVPGLVELRVAITEALVERDVDYARNHGFEAHITIEAQPDPTTLEEALRRSESRPLHFDSILLVRGDEHVAEIPLVGPPPLTAAADPPQWTPPAGDEVINVAALIKQLRAKTDPVRNAFLKATMEPHLAEARIDFDVTNPLTAKVLSQAGSQVKGIAETTQLNVMRIIGQSYAAGLSIPDTAKAIRAGMASASTWRATMIARTELAGAANGGSLAATQLVQDVTGEGYYKQWLTAPGAPHPRHEDYEGLDGQTVALEEAFDVGGEPLQFPGDPDGDPGETINCRCALSYTNTPPEDQATGPGVSPETALTDGVAPEGAQALDDVMPLTPPPGDDISVNAPPFVPMSYVERIKRDGLDASFKDAKPLTAEGRQAYNAERGMNTAEIFDGPKHGGEWTPERREKHMDILARNFAGKTPPPADTPRVLSMTAGGGASGKGGTLVDVGGGKMVSIGDLEKDREIAMETGVSEYPNTILVNADLIKEQFSEYGALTEVGDPYAAIGVHEESSRLAKDLERLAREQGYNIVFDGTAAGQSALDRITSYAAKDYRVRISMTSAPTNAAIVRSVERGDRSGRYVYAQAIKEAHAGASRMFDVWRDLPDVYDWKLEDTSDIGKRVLVAERKHGGETIIYDQEKYDAIRAKQFEKSFPPGATPAHGLGGTRLPEKPRRVAPADWKLNVGGEEIIPTLEDEVVNAQWDADAADVAGAALSEAAQGTGDLRYLTDPKTAALGAIANVEYGPDAVLIHNLASSGQGAGTELLKRIAQEALDYDGLGVRLVAKPGTDAYYRRLGFVETAPAENGKPTMMYLSPSKARALIKTEGVPASPPVVPGELTPTLQALMPGPEIFTVTQIEKEQAYSFAGRAADRKMTSQEYADAVTAKLKDVLASPEVSIRIRADALEGVLKDGRFKSQFETKTSGGALAPASRAGTERAMFGYPAGRAAGKNPERAWKFPPEKRPIYGYLSGSLGQTAGNQYGDLRVVLKPDVIERTTFSLQDSLGGGGSSMLPTPVLNPSVLAYDSGYRTDDVLKTLSLPPDEDPLRRASSYYAEAQIHGGVSADDIEEVFLPYKGISATSRARLEDEKAYYESVKGSERDIPGRIAEIDAALAEDAYAGLAQQLEARGIKVTRTYGDVDGRNFETGISPHS